MVHILSACYQDKTTDTNKDELILAQNIKLINDTGNLTFNAGNANDILILLSTETLNKYWQGNHSVNQPELRIPFNKHSSNYSGEVLPIKAENIEQLVSLKQYNIVLLINSVNNAKNLNVLSFRDDKFHAILSFPLSRKYTDGGGFTTIGSLNISKNKEQTDYPDISFRQTSLPSKSDDVMRPGPPLAYLFQYDVLVGKYLSK